MHAITTACPHCGARNRLPPERPALQANCGACHKPLFIGQPLETDEAGLAGHLAADLPILLDVWAPWCAPCRAMAPAFAAAATTLEPSMRLLKLNADNARATCTRLGVHGIPALFLLQSGRVLAHTAGAMDRAALQRWAQSHLPGAA